MKIAQILTLLVLLSCIPETESPLHSTSSVVGFVPVYGEKALTEIKFSPPRTIVNPGKIYTYQNLLFVNERNQGVHVFDNQNPSQPLPLKFIEILGNNDIAIKNSVMYADHVGNIVALNLNDLKSLDLIATLSLSNWLLGVPPPGRSYFECIDSEKGLVVAWKSEILSNPNCYAF